MKFFTKIFGEKDKPKVAIKYESQEEVVHRVFADYDFPKDLQAANKIIFGRFFYPSAPFTLWKDPSINLPDSLEVITKLPCQFLMLRYWFWFLTSNYGPVASGMLKDEFDDYVIELNDAEPKGEINLLEQINYYFSEIDEAVDHYEEMPEDKKSFKGSDGKSLVMPWEYYFALKVIIHSVDSPYYKVEDATKLGNNDTLVMGCLGYSKYLAEATYNEFKKHLLDFDAHVLKTWKWKATRGLSEQYLFIKHNSVFFEDKDRVITPYDVYIARCKDVESWRGFYAQYLELNKEILEDDIPNDTIGFIIKKREELDDLINHVDALGVGKRGLDVELDRLRKSLIDIWMYIYREQKNESGLATLQEAEELNKLNPRRNYPDFIKFLLSDSLPADHVVPSFLSLSLNELKEVVSYIETQDSLRETLLSLRTGALDVVNKVRGEIKNLNEVKEKLSVIGVAL